MYAAIACPLSGTLVIWVSSLSTGAENISEVESLTNSSLSFSLLAPSDNPDCNVSVPSDAVFKPSVNVTEPVCNSLTPDDILLAPLERELIPDFKAELLETSLLAPAFNLLAPVLKVLKPSERVLVADFKVVNISSYDERLEFTWLATAKAPFSAAPPAIWPTVEETVGEIASVIEDAVILPDTPFKVLETIPTTRLWACSFVYPTAWSAPIIWAILESSSIAEDIALTVASAVKVEDTLLLTALPIPDDNWSAYPDTLEAAVFFIVLFCSSLNSTVGMLIPWTEEFNLLAPADNFDAPSANSLDAELRVSTPAKYVSRPLDKVVVPSVNVNILSDKVFNPSLILTPPSSSLVSPSLSSKLPSAASPRLSPIVSNCSKTVWA